MQNGDVVTVFLSSYVNGVDKKGRVSVPAAFRTELAAQSRPTVVVYAAPDGAYLMGWGYDDFLKFAEKIKRMPALSAQRQRLARTLLAAARPLSPDDTGRIQLPEDFLSHIHIKGGEKAIFAGQGDYFTIWQPEEYAEKETADKALYESDLDALTADWEAIG